MSQPLFLFDFDEKDDNVSFGQALYYNKDIDLKDYND